MNAIKIVPNGPISYNVYLDGADISKYVRGLSINMLSGHTPVVKIEIAASLVEIPDELLSLVVAEKDESL